MAGLTTITVDLARGEVVLGGRRVGLAAERGDAGVSTGRPPSRFRLDDGAIVRLIGFGERSRLVRDALADAVPSQALVGLLRAAAHEGPCSTLADAVLLAMAGGAETAPEFERCAVEASRLQAWNWLSVHDAPAIVVDRVIAQPAGPEPAGGWNRFVFPGSDGREIEVLLQEMVASLLTRGMPVAGVVSADSVSTDSVGADSVNPESVDTARSDGDRPVQAAADPSALPGSAAAAGSGRPSRRARMLGPEHASARPAAQDGGPDQAAHSSTTSAGGHRLSRPGAGQLPRPRRDAPAARAGSPLPPGGTGAPPARRAAMPPPQRSGAASSPPAAWPRPARLPLTAWPPRTAAGASTQPLPAAAGAARQGPEPAVRPAAAQPGHSIAAAAAGRDAVALFAAAPFDRAPSMAATTVPQPMSAAAATAVAAMAMPVADLLDELAHALAAECDLRGLDA